MADPPFFLRECNKFPTTTTTDDDIPNDRSRRAFELSVSLETLLEINDAAELMFEFLSDDEHYEKVVWLSDDIYVKKGRFLLEPIIIDGRVFLEPNVMYSICIDFVGHYVYICQQSSANRAVTEQAPPAESSAPSQSLLDNQIGLITDTILLLLAKSKTIKSIELHRGDSLSSDEPFPASREGLQAFVSEARSPRKLLFVRDLLSGGQWSVVISHCNNYVKLVIDLEFLNDERVMVPLLVKAMKLNQCPAKLELRYPNQMSTEEFRDFVAALESTTSLQELDVAYTRSKESFVALCQAISHNRSKLHVVRLLNGRYEPWTLSDSEWELVCLAITSHPTLKQLEFNMHTEDSSRSPERDQFMIQHISKNTVLWDIHFDNRNCCIHNVQHVKQAVRPVLVLNRFRFVVQTRIQQETDVARRQKLFTSIMMSPHVRQRPSFCFLLLKENSDLLAELSKKPRNEDWSDHQGKHFVGCK